MAAVVALAVFAAAGVFAWRAFNPGSTSGSTTPGTSSGLRVYTDPLGWTASYPSDWHVFTTERTADGLGMGVTFENRGAVLQQGAVQDYVTLQITHSLSATADPSGGSSAFPISASDFEPDPGPINSSALEFTIDGVRYLTTLRIGGSASKADISAMDTLIASIRPSTTGTSPAASYWVRFPDAISRTDTGLEIVATTNLPDGTLYLIDGPNGGACCPPVKDGHIVVSMNDAGQIDSPQAYGCRALQQGHIAAARDLQITITVDSQIGDHIMGQSLAPTSGSGSGRPQQPDSVLAILGVHFENLTGDQVVQTKEGNRLVATQTYPWPKPRC